MLRTMHARVISGVDSLRSEGRRPEMDNIILTSRIQHVISGTVGKAGLSIVPVVPWEGAPAASRGPPINCQLFTTLCRS